MNSQGEEKTEEQPPNTRSADFLRCDKRSSSLGLGADPPWVRFGKADAFVVRKRLLLDPGFAGKVGADDCASLFKTVQMPINQYSISIASTSRPDISYVVLNRGAFRVPRPVRFLLDPTTERTDLGTGLRTRAVRALKDAVELVVLVDAAGVVDTLGAERAAKGFCVGVD